MGAVASSSAEVGMRRHLCLWAPFLRLVHGQVGAMRESHQGGSPSVAPERRCTSDFEWVGERLLINCGGSNGGLLLPDMSGKAL